MCHVCVYDDQYTHCVAIQKKKAICIAIRFNGHVERMRTIQIDVFLKIKIKIAALVDSYKMVWCMKGLPMALYPYSRE